MDTSSIPCSFGKILLRHLKWVIVIPENPEGIIAIVCKYYGTVRTDGQCLM